MSEFLPIEWADKKNSPLLEEFITKHGADYCMTAEEINQLRDGMNELDLSSKNIKSNQSLSLAKRKDDVIYGILDQYTGEQITLSKVTGTPTVDGIIYFQLGVEYFKRNEKLSLKNYGAKANAIYNTTGDPAQLQSGDYDTSFFILAISKFIDNNFSKTGGNLLKIPLGNYRLKASLVGFNIEKNNSILDGDGAINTILHFERDSSVDEKSIVFSKPTGSADERLIRGGGLKNLTIKTNNANIISYGLELDYVEYMVFENITLENFYKSALYGGIWESEFSNIVIRSSGAGLADGLLDNIPLLGVLDFDSHSALPYRDACNNTNFFGLNFSSCFGTLIRSNPFGNTNVNLSFFGLKGESSNVDAGVVDNLPTFYIDATSNFNVNGGFFTQNQTGVLRSGTVLQIGNEIRNGLVSFSNYIFSMNHVGGSYVQNSFQRLKSFINLSGENSHLFLSNCTLNDPSGSVGMTSGGYLIEGGIGSKLVFDNLVVNVKYGLRDISNIFNPNIELQGNLTIVYFNDSIKLTTTEAFVFSKKATQTTNGSLKKAIPQLESTATTVSDLKTDFNTLLEKLKVAGIVDRYSLEILPNSNFYTDTSWSKGTGWSISDGLAKHSGGDGLLSALGTLTIGKNYRIEYRLNVASGIVQASAGGVNDATKGVSGVYSYEITATTTDNVSVYAAGFVGSVDYISVKEII